MIEANIHTEIETSQQQGYQGLNSGSLAACRAWRKVWDLLSQLMQSGQYASIEELDKAFHGPQSIVNWANDFAAELRKAGSEDAGFLQQCIDFCCQYLAWSNRQTGLNSLSLYRLIAECTFALGRPAEGDASFRDSLAQNPWWGWGWISWAEQYAAYAKVGWHDLKKAETILRQALAVKELRDRPEVARRLRDILIKQGRAIEASGIEPGL